MRNTTTKRAMTAAQAAQALNMTHPAIRVALKDGRLRGYKDLSGKWHVTLDSVKAWSRFREVRALRAENSKLIEERDYLQDLLTSLVSSVTGDELAEAVLR